MYCTIPRSFSLFQSSEECSLHSLPHKQRDTRTQINSPSVQAYHWSLILGVMSSIAMQSSIPDIHKLGRIFFLLFGAIYAFGIIVFTHQFALGYIELITDASAWNAQLVLGIAFFVFVGPFAAAFQKMRKPGECNPPPLLRVSSPLPFPLSLSTLLSNILGSCWLICGSYVLSPAPFFGACPLFVHFPTYSHPSPFRNIAFSRIELFRTLLTLLHRSPNLLIKFIPSNIHGYKFSDDLST